MFTGAGRRRRFRRRGEAEVSHSNTNAPQMKDQKLLNNLENISLAASTLYFVLNCATKACPIKLELSPKLAKSMMRGAFDVNSEAGHLRHQGLTDMQCFKIRIQPSTQLLKDLQALERKSFSYRPGKGAGCRSICGNYGERNSWAMIERESDAELREDLERGSV